MSARFRLLKEFLRDAWFTQGVITLTSSSFSYSEGEIVDTITESITLKGKKVLVPVNTKDLIDMGFGQYVGGESFYVYSEDPFKYANGSLAQKNDKITFNGKEYTFITELDFATHGFYKYLIVKYMPAVLND